MSMSGKLGSLKTQIAHNQFLSALGNKDIKVLQDVITSEKVSMASSINSSRESEKVAENVKSWGWGEGDDLKDVCAAAGTLIHHYAAATSTAASYQTKIREQFKRIRTREEELDDLKKRRKTLGSKIESAEKKLAKMNSENKNLPQQTQLLESFRQQASDLDVEIVNSEALIWDYKRATTKTALGYKFCSLVEYAEKVSIIGEMGKLLIEEIQLEPSIPGQPHPPYVGAEQTRKIVEQAEKSLSQVTFGPLPLTSRPPELDVSAHDFAPRIDSRDVKIADTVDSGFKTGITPELTYDEPTESTKPWIVHNNPSLNSVDSNGDFRTSNNPDAYPDTYDSYSSANAYKQEYEAHSPPHPPPIVNMEQKPRGSLDDTPHHAQSPAPSANSLRRARGDKTQYDYDTSAFFSRNHAGGYNDAPVWSSATPAPILTTKPSVNMHGGEISAPESGHGTPHNLSSGDVNYIPPHEESAAQTAQLAQPVQHTQPPQVHFERPEGAIQGIGLQEDESREASPQPPAYNNTQQTSFSDDIPRYQLNDAAYTPANEAAAPPAPPKTPPEQEDIYGGIVEEHTSPLPNPYDTPPAAVANPPHSHNYENQNQPQHAPLSFSPTLQHNNPRTLTAGAFKRSNRDSPNDSTAPLNIQKRDSPDNGDIGPPPPRLDSLT